MKKRILSIIMTLVMALSLLPTAALAAGLPFTDVKTSDWFYNDVKNAYDKGLINGKTATTFEPNSNLTYAEAVKLAACMNQRNATGMVTLINGNPWYATYVGYAKDNGIISKDYDWNAKATRAGYMEIFAHALPASNLKPINNVPDGAIPDVPMSHPQADAIYTLYRAGILQGSDSQHNCKPNDNIKRSEVAAILTRMMDVKERISFSMAEEVEELTITAQPKDVTCAVGDTAEFTVMAAGGKEPYTYQWQARGVGDFKNLKNGSGATMKLTTTAAMFDVKQVNSFISEIRCVITDADGNKVTSDEAKLVKKTEALTITTQPKPVTCAVGDPATFTVAVTGGKEPYTYQWQARGVSKEFKNLRNSSGATLNLTTTAAMFDVKQVNSFISEVQCIITDADGNKVTSNAVKLTKAQTTPLTITTQPKDVYTSKGGSAFSASYTVEATGGKAPYTYQWQWGKTTGNGWTDIKNTDTWANSGTIKSKALLIGSQQESMLTAGYIFRCVITDANGEKVYSSAASLNKELTITKHPIDVTCTVPEGDKLNRGFVVVVEGGAEPYTYQWQYRQGTGAWKDASTLNWASGQDTLGMVITVYNGTFDWNYSFRCIVTDANGTSVTSNAAYLYEGAAQTTPLTITKQPVSQTININGRNEIAQFKVEVTGGVTPYKYQWQYETATGYADITSNSFRSGTMTLYSDGTLRFSDMVSTESFNIRCKITDSAGNIIYSDPVVFKIERY